MGHSWVLDWSNPTLVWMLRAYHSGDTARNQNSRQASVASAARKMVCVFPATAQEDGQFLRVEPVARWSTPKVALERFEEPEDLAGSSDVLEFAVQSPAAAVGRCLVVGFPP